VKNLPFGEFELEMTRLPWEDRRCILCTLTLPLTLEHLIPQSLGGILECRFLCSACNSRMGELYEG
jgi:5-methylcytosine-specific restriction endonuclease McrA